MSIFATFVGFNIFINELTKKSFRSNENFVQLVKRIH